MTTKRRTPSVPPLPKKPKKNCSDCIYYIGDVNGWCCRYPRRERVNKDYCCGEIK